MSRMNISEVLQSGLALHREGRLGEAEAQYRQVLAAAPGQPDALYLLGSIALATKHFEGAIQLMTQAVEAEPRQSGWINDLGEAFRALGRSDEALAHYRRALALNPDEVSAQNNLGIILAERADYAGAEAAFARVMALRPDLADAHSNLGNLLREQGRLEEAIACFEKALELSPGLVDALTNLSSVLSRIGRVEEAIALAERALVVDPGSGAAHLNLGCALRLAGRPNEALRCFDRAIAANALYAAPGREGTPGHRYLAMAHLNRAFIHLLLGEHTAGWAGYEWRWPAQGEDAQPADCAGLPWRGEPLAGRALLLHAEQGFGDTLHMARFFTDVAARGGQILLRAQPPLRRLLSAMPAVARWCPEGEPVPKFAVHCPMMSLPRVLGPAAAASPPNVPYLTAPPEEAARWAEELQGEKRLKVGLAWAGDPVHKDDRLRSLPLATLAPLLAVPGVRWFSLQKGPAAGQAEAFPALEQVGERLVDFAATAALVMNLDLVIAVDTAVVHLTGALARPVWILVPFAPDWRWGHEGDATALYPTARLFRRAQRDCWESTVARVAAALTERAGARSAPAA